MNFLSCLSIKKIYFLILGFSDLKEKSQEYEEFHPGVAQYEDFHTIDWLRDLVRDRYRHRYISRKMGESWCNLLSGYYDKVTGWICVFLVGVLAGMNMFIK